MRSAQPLTLLPVSKGNNEDPDPNVRLSTLVQSVVDNYTKYHELSEQLQALQSWLREVEALHNK
jgi:hypothetical protein